MVTLYFIATAVLNLSLGYALASVLLKPTAAAHCLRTPPPAQASPASPPLPNSLSAPIETAEAPAESVPEPTVDEPAVEIPAKPEGDEPDDDDPADDDEPTAACQEDEPADDLPRYSDEIPQEWIDLLDETVHTNSFVEAAIHVLKLQVGRYRDMLIEIDRRVRELAPKPDLPALRKCLADLKQINQQWLKNQADAAKKLANRKSLPPNFTEIGDDLEDVLLDQAAQIETTCNNIEMLDFESNLKHGCRRLITEIIRLIDACHGLRDRMHESYLAVIMYEGRLQSIDRGTQTDTLTGLLNLVGVWRVVEDWLCDDPDHERLASVALIDINATRRLTEEHGPLIGDRVIRGIGHLIDSLMRKNRGMDVCCRFAGQQFFAFLGDTGPHNATSALERIRQTIAASKFAHNDDIEIEVRVNSAVVEVQPGDSAGEMLRRAQETLQVSKEAGHDRTFLNEGSGPVQVDPPKYDVKAQVIRLEEQL